MLDYSRSSAQACEFFGHMRESLDVGISSSLTNTEFVLDRLV